MSLFRDLLIAGFGGGASLLLREGVRYYRRPRLVIDLYEAQGEQPYFPSRNLGKARVHLDDQKVTRYNRTKDIHLSVSNGGLRPARGCEVTMDIYEEGKEIPKPIRLGWRKRRPVLYDELSDPEGMRQRTAPFDINRRDDALLDVLRLHYFEFQSEQTEEVVKREVDKLTTLASFRPHEFDPETDYRLEITLTGSNVNPSSISLNLHWNRGLEDEDLQSAIEVRE